MWRKIDCTKELLKYKVKGETNKLLYLRFDVQNNEQLDEMLSKNKYNTKIIFEPAREQLQFPCQLLSIQKWEGEWLDTKLTELTLIEWDYFCDREDFIDYGAGEGFTTVDKLNLLYKTVKVMDISNGVNYDMITVDTITVSGSRWGFEGEFQYWVGADENRYPKNIFPTNIIAV